MMEKTYENKKFSKRDNPQSLPATENEWVTVHHKNKKAIDKANNNLPDTPNVENKIHNDRRATQSFAKTTEKRRKKFLSKQEKNTLALATDLQDVPSDSYKIKIDCQSVHKDKNILRNKQKNIDQEISDQGKNSKKLNQKATASKVLVDAKSRVETRPTTAYKSIEIGIVNDVCNDFGNEVFLRREKVKNKNKVDPDKMKILQKERKQQRNQEKTFRKEEKVRRLKKENSKKDSKVKCISQDIMNSFSGSNVSTAANSSNGNITYEYQNDKKIFDSLLEYPSLSNSFRRPNKFKAQKQLPKNIEQDVQTVTPSSKVVEESISSPAENSSSNGDFSDVLKTYESANSDFSDNEDEIEDESTLTDSPTKKSVKSRDPISLDIIDLIHVPKKPDKLSKANQTKQKVKSERIPLKVEKRGKISEGKSKKLSTLKKNMKRYDKRQKEFLCAHNSHDNAEGNESRTTEERVTSNIEHEPVSKVSENKENVIETKCVKRPGVDNSSSETCGLDVLKEQNGNRGVDTRTCRNVDDLPNGTSRISPVDARQEFEMEMKKSATFFHNNKFRDYCDHVTTPEIDEALKGLLMPLVMFQNRTFKQDPIKAKMKRRYYCGFKEALKHMRKTICIIMVPNIKFSPGAGCIDELVKKVLSAASAAGVLVIFGLDYRQLGRICRKRVPVSCISILTNGIQGVQDKYAQLVELIPPAKKKYQELIGKGQTVPALNETVDDLAVEQCPQDNKESRVTDSLLEALKT